MNPPFYLPILLGLLALGTPAPAQGDPAPRDPAPLQGTARVFGSVRAPTGEAVAGATVHALGYRLAGVPPVLAAMLRQEARVVASATTDERGRFVLALERPEAVAIYATRGAGRGLLRSPTVHPVAPGSILELEATPVESRGGRIAADGDVEFSKLRIGVWFERGPRGVGGFAPHPHRPTPFFCEPMGWGEVGADGGFELQAPAGPAWVAGLPQLPMFQSVVGGAQSPALEVAGRVRVKRGRVVDRAGRPVAGASLWSERAPWGLSGTRSAADGSFELLVAGDPYLLCHAPGCTPDGFLASQETLKLQRGNKSRVRLEGQDGEPLADAELILVHWTQGPVTSSPVPVAARTDARGEFDHYGFYPATAYLLTDERVVRLFDLAAEREPTQVVVVSALRTLRGIVRDATGAPAAHVPVCLALRTAHRREHYANAWQPVAYTDHGGRFTLSSVVDGEYWIGARSLAAGPTVMDVTVAGDRLALELRMPEVSVFRGRVVDAEGGGHAGVLVGALCGMRVEEKYSRLGLAEAYVWTAADGSFAVAAIDEAQEHRLSVRWPGDYEERYGVNVEPGADPLTIELAR